MSDRGLTVRVRQSAPIPLDVELACARGELLALVGPSGSGKSTLLKSIAGLLRVRTGLIRCGEETWLDTENGVRVSPQRRRVGVVFQQYALFPHLSALANVMEALHDLPSAERKGRALGWLERLHLRGLEHRRPAQLSGGQQQRVALARALARGPRALLLDEPFSAVDRMTRVRLYEEVADLRRDLAMPVIMVTHDLDEALLLADRMSILSDGVILQSGSPFEVMIHPNSPRVAGLLGHRNIFRAGVVEHAPARGETLIEWRGHRLRAKLQTQFAAGQQVAWTIPRSHVVLADRKSAGEGDGNTVNGVVAQLVKLGENASIIVHVDRPDRPPVFLSAPMHVVRGSEIAPGAQVAVRFLAEAIHLMPGDRHAAARNVRSIQADNI